MNRLIVNGGRRLNGTALINGAKNSVLPLLAATLINSGINVLHNCPQLADVDSAVRILRHLGCKVERKKSTITVDSSVLTGCEVPDELMREMRSSVIFLGPIIARCGCAKLTAPGGCELGHRPIDLHLDALRRLGVDIAEDGGKISCKTENMRGCDIILAFPSVGATENIMLAATACQGVTRIINAAREPEIVDLELFLQKAGVNVSGAGNGEITINPCNAMHDTVHSVMADRIECATYLCACALCGGKLELKNAQPGHVGTVISLLREASCDIKTAGRCITIESSGKLNAMRNIRTMPYPGFPTDALAPMVAAASIANGTTVFCETIFENRFRHAGELARMGADIKVNGRLAIVNGVKRLEGAAVRCTDLRGGAALAIAAMAADGQSEITDIAHIDRGYESIETAYGNLGADIKRM